MNKNNWIMKFSAQKNAMRRHTLLIPELEEMDHSISSLSVKKARLLLDGDQTALSSLKSEIEELSAQKPALLKSHGLPANYLEMHYQCPDCKDTGYIGTHKCHCFKKAIVDYLYTQSNLKDILDKENFSTCSLTYYSRNHIDLYRTVFSGIMEPH